MYHGKRKGSGSRSDITYNNGLVHLAKAVTNKNAEECSKNTLNEASASLHKKKLLYCMIFFKKKEKLQFFLMTILLGYV